jgi:hypothetical protein
VAGRGDPALAQLFALELEQGVATRGRDGVVLRIVEERPLVLVRNSVS